MQEILYPGLENLGRIWYMFEDTFMQIDDFSTLSCDVNPVHKPDVENRSIVHGIFVGSMFSAMIGTRVQFLASFNIVTWNHLFEADSFFPSSSVFWRCCYSCHIGVSHLQEEKNCSFKYCCSRLCSILLLPLYLGWELCM